MSTVTPYIGLLRNLRGEFDPGMGRLYIPVERAHKRLVELSGVDFGFDAVKWETWIRENTKEFELEELRQRCIQRRIERDVDM